MPNALFMKKLTFILFLNLFYIAINFVSAQNTVSVNKTTFCISETVEVKSKFKDTTNYTLNWEYKTTSLGGWSNIQILNCTRLIKDSLLNLSNFANPDSIYIRCIYKNKILTQTDSTSNTVSFKVLPKLTAPRITSIAKPICYNDTPPPIDVTTPSGGAGLSSYKYQWYFSPDSTSIFMFAINQTTIQCKPEKFTGSRFYTLEVKSDCYTVYSDTIKITVLPEIVTPQITSITQPICYDTPPGILSIISPSKDNFNYQWQDSISGRSFSNIDGATTTTYQAGKLTKTTFYRVIATSKYGCGVFPSLASKVEVYDAITVEDLPGETICYNTKPNSLTAIPHGGDVTTNYTYQWNESESLTGTFTIIPGETSKKFTPGNLTSTKYYKVVIGSGGCTPKTSNPITINVNPELKSGNIKSSEPICYDSIPQKFTSTKATGGDENYTYQWQQDSISGNNFSDIPGAKSETYQAGKLKKNTSYRLIVFSGSGCGSDTSNVITITVFPENKKPEISPLTQSICYNTRPPIEISAKDASGSGTTFTYQWQMSTNRIRFENIGVATSSATSYQPDKLLKTTYFRLMATSSNGGCEIPSEISEVVVYDKLTVSISPDTAICYHVKPNPIKALAHGEYGKYFYQWQDSISDGKPFKDIVGALSDSYQPPTLDSVHYYQVIVVSEKGCITVTSNIKKITVYKDFKPGSITGNQEVCYEKDAETIKMDVGATGGQGDNDKYTYEWEISPDDSNWSPIPGEILNNYTPKKMTSTSFFRMQVSSLCGKSPTNSVKVKVNPLPIPIVSISGDTCVCSNQFADYSINRDLDTLKITTEWSITGGEILYTNGINVKDISVKWDKTSSINKLTIKQKVKLTGCELVKNYPIKKLTTQSPDRKDILRKSTTNILISTEKDPNIHFQWGFTSLSPDKNISTILDSDRRYVLFPTILDTKNYAYWVITTNISEKDTCNTTSIYDANKASIKTADENVYSVYPNPTKSEINIENSSDKNTTYTIKIASLTGKIIYEKVIENSIDQLINLKLNLQKGIYLLEISDIDRKTTQKLIIN